jgi:hypothetical protein
MFWVVSGEPSELAPFKLVCLDVHSSLKSSSSSPDQHKSSTDPNCTSKYHNAQAHTVYQME